MDSWQGLEQSVVQGLAVVPPPVCCSQWPEWLYGFSSPANSKTKTRKTRVVGQNCLAIVMGQPANKRKEVFVW